MSSHKEEITGPGASQIWQSFQKEMLPYLLSVLPDELYLPGRETDLFVALNQALYDKYVADGEIIPEDIQFNLQLDICALMPAFAKLPNARELLQKIFAARAKAKTGPVEEPSAGRWMSPIRIVGLSEAAAYREDIRRAGKRVVATNGCFDLLHVGHLRYLTEARAFGDFLWVGLNGDASVRELKGSGRPLVPEADRAELLAAWRGVDAVTIFPEVRATAFLRAVQPDIYVKGGDYTAESLNPEETAALRECGARIEIVRLVPGKSTSKLVEKMALK